MPLAPGTRLGAYQILAFLDEGRIGKVWRARHAAVNRDAAMKETAIPDFLQTDHVVDSRGDSREKVITRKEGVESASR
jgi:hypothetical protein